MPPEPPVTSASLDAMRGLQSAAEYERRRAHLTRVVAQLRDRDVGRAARYRRRELVDARADRLQHEVARRTHAAAQRNALGIDDRDHVREPEREIRRKPLPSGQRMCVARLRGAAYRFRAELFFVLVEQRAAGKRGRYGRRVADQAGTGRLCFKAADLSASADKAVRGPDLMMADLAGARAVSNQQAAVRNDSPAQPRTDREQHEILRPPADAEPVFSQRRAPRVVGNEYRRVENGADRSEEHTSE